MRGEPVRPHCHFLTLALPLTQLHAQPAPDTRGHLSLAAKEAERLLPVAMADEVNMDTAGLQASVAEIAADNAERVRFSQEASALFGEAHTHLQEAYAALVTAHSRMVACAAAASGQVGAPERVAAATKLQAATERFKQAAENVIAVVQAQLNTFWSRIDTI